MEKDTKEMDVNIGESDSLDDNVQNEMKPNESDKDINEDIKYEEDKLNKSFCVYCGEEIVSNLTYCKKCGHSVIDTNKIHCTNCGEELSEGQQFCAKCGQKVKNSIVSKGIDEAREKVKKVNKKKIILPVAIIFIIIVFTLAAKFAIPQIFVSTETYLAGGNYKKAYSKAKKSEKKNILLENIVAYLSAEAKEHLKNSDSFKLREAWDYDENNQFVLKVQGTNSIGGKVSNYWLCTFSKEEQKYTIFTTISDFEDEKYSKYDDDDESMEKLLNNLAREIIKDIISDKHNQLDSKVPKRINEMNKKDILDDVELIDEVKTIYPKEDEDESDGIKS